MGKNRKPALTLVGATETTWPDPPRKLLQHGRALWDRIQRDYDIRDAGGIELLLLACEAIDRAHTLRAEIASMGGVMRQRSGGLRENPALRGELAAMAFVARTLARLGLNLEPTRPSVGRPGSGLGVTGI